MDTKKSLFWNKAMFWGFIVALASMLTTTVYYSTDNMASTSQSWIDYAITIGGIVVCAIVYKQTLHQNDEFTYGNALGLGVATIFFSSLILAVFTYVLYTYIDPELHAETIRNTEQVLLDSGYSDDMVEQQMALGRKFMTPAAMSIMFVFVNTFKGFIVALITSIFLKRNAANGFEAAMSEIEED